MPGMRKVVLALMILVAFLAIGLFFVPDLHLGQHHLVLKTYFDNAKDLRSRADVRLAGVRVGAVRSVEARPELKDRPAEVVMDLWTPNELRIPKDALVSVAQDGLLGTQYVAIEVSGTIGETAKSGDTLRTRPTETLSTKEIVDGIKEAVQGTAKGDTSSKQKSPK